jgi:hypothetical protein
MIPENLLLPARCLSDGACGCELVNLHLFPAQLSNFWTSSFYLLFALLLYWRLPDKSFIGRSWIIAMLVLGLSSMLAHGTFWELGMAMDFAAIVTVLGFFIMFNFFKRISPQWWFIPGAFLISFILLVWGFHSLYKWGKIALCVLVFVFALAEVIRSTGLQFLKARSLFYSLLSVSIGFAFFILDESKLWCDPHGLVPGHAFWHLGTAAGLYFYGKWRLLEEVL